MQGSQTKKARSQNWNQVPLTPAPALCSFFKGTLSTSLENWGALDKFCRLDEVLYECWISAFENSTGIMVK